MKRFHVHVAVPDLQQSIRFYSTLFGAPPSVVKGDYAKWMLEDPRVNFAISKRGDAAGIRHLGFQVESDGELKEIEGRLSGAKAQVTEERNVTCCYARSDKYWTTDPAGVPWESFHSLGSAASHEGEEKTQPAAATCCGPEQTACCVERPRSEKAACC